MHKLYYIEEGQDSCKFSSNYIFHMWEHREENHPGQTPKNFPKPKDMLLALVAEQNVDVIEELENLRKDMKIAFQEVALAMDGATNDAAVVRSHATVDDPTANDGVVEHRSA